MVCKFLEVSDACVFYSFMFGGRYVSFSALRCFWLRVVRSSFLSTKCLAFAICILFSC